MTNKDWTPGSQPIEDADPLSATGMFLSALGKESSEAQTGMDSPQAPTRREAQAPAWPTQETPPASQAETPFRTAVDFEPQKSAPGEFTRLFQATGSAAAAPVKPATPPPASSFEPKPAPASAPGEFTRIFVTADSKPTDRAPSPPPAKSIADAPPATHQAASQPRMKGFSSGASDSASAEGGFTQFFQARPSAPAPSPAPTPTPTPRVQAYSPPAPSPAPPVEDVKPRQPDFSASQGSSDSGANSPSVTSLFASLAPSKPSQQEVKPQSYEPLPSFTPTPTPARPPEPSPGEAGSVTRLIQRLSSAPAVEPPAAPVPIAAPPPSSGPGEFTRMINAGAMRTAPSAPAPAPAAPPAAAAPMPPMPAFAPPAMPAAPKPAAPPPPAFQAPKLEPPKPAAPAIAAPKSKLEEMVPILLVVNTFLLIVLIVLVAFALKAR
jgi:hypothetical protein